MSGLPINKAEMNRLIKSREAATRSNAVAGNSIERRTKINFN
jgi:hypothetical protein